MEKLAGLIFSIIWDVIADTIGSAILNKINRGFIRPVLDRFFVRFDSVEEHNPQPAFRPVVLAGGAGLVMLAAGELWLLASPGGLTAVEFFGLVGGAALTMFGAAWFGSFGGRVGWALIRSQVIADVCAVLAGAVTGLVGGVAGVAAAIVIAGGS